MKLYHYTTQESATQIIADGFLDSPPSPALGWWAGVWFSDSPDAEQRGMARPTRAAGVMLVVEVPDDVVDRFLIAEFPRRWREFCIPASVANAWPRERVPAGTQLTESDVI